MIKGMDNMDIDFLSILRNMSNVTFPLSVYHCSNIRNKISMIGNQTNTFSGAAIAITISVCTVCALSFFLMSIINTPSVYAANTNSSNSILSSLVITKQGSFWMLMVNSML